MTDEERLYEKLMLLPGIGALEVEPALQCIGTLIDVSASLGRPEGAARALAWSHTMEKGGMPESEAALLEYFRANAWSAQRNARHGDRAAAWAWEQPELQKEIFHLRRAARHLGFRKLDEHRQCQVFTNLGNGLNTLGRFVEALEYWERALSINPRFAMALGNRGYGLMHYARALYDGGHQALFFRFAHADFAAAVGSEAQFESPKYELIKSAFDSRRAALESLLGDRLSQRLELDKYEIGGSEEERAYRRWCLGRQLFLNPLNDLGSHTIACRDVLTLPDFVTAVEEPLALIGLFNQMKQEFVSARWLYYEGTQSQDVHFSDSDVLLYNTLDYPVYSLAIEKVKAAYRAAYSLFDKAGFFLNRYMGIGLAPEQVSFRRIWLAKSARGERAVRSEFERSENWALRGLFWLSKDLFEEDFQDVMDPDAQALREIRNHLEHKYLKVHDMLFALARERGVSGPWNDDLAYSVQRADFEAKTLRLLKLARTALIHVSLGMHMEESRRNRQAKDKGLIIPMDLDTWDDDWKR
jgi:hypothetical protein